MASNRQQALSQNLDFASISLWDGLAIVCLAGLLFILANLASAMQTPYAIGETIPIHLDWSYLPHYALRSVGRMMIALLCSLLLTFVFGTWAGKSKRAEMIIVPMVDILQSAPVLSFLAIMAPLFISLFPGSMLGPECAAIFAIITSQLWNMLLSFYQSIKMVPHHMREVSALLQMNSWQVFWRIEVPFAMPNLIWNMMVSMSASWFFVVASEAITVANQTITLPGLGSYISVAISERNLIAVYQVIAMMLLVIFLYNAVFFRPLIQWATKFASTDDLDDKTDRSFMGMIFFRSRLMQWLSLQFSRFWSWFVMLSVRSPVVKKGKRSYYFSVFTWLTRHSFWVWCSLQFKWIRQQESLSLSLLVKGIRSLYIAMLWSLPFLLLWGLAKLLHHQIPSAELVHVAWLGIVTGVKVLLLTFVCSLIWVPVGVMIGTRPRLTQWLQPMVQFLAAFPVNLIYPLVVFGILHYQLNPNIWTAPLMILGTQWYILFNVISGASQLPRHLNHVVSCFHVKGLLWWRRVIFPAIFSSYVTGAMTAAGGAWNASIVAEVVDWGGYRVESLGLGAYITQFYESGDFFRVIWGTIVMCVYVVVLNHLVWKPLYRYASDRFQVE